MEESRVQRWSISAGISIACTESRSTTGSLLVDKHSCHALHNQRLSWVVPVPCFESCDTRDASRTRIRTSKLGLTMPEPIHMLVTKIFFFSLFASAKPVAIWRAPVAPRGWPMAMAPPTGLTFSNGILRCWIDMTACEAKAWGKRSVRIDSDEESREDEDEVWKCTRLVDLKKVDVVFGDTRLLQHSGDSKRGACSHSAGLDWDGDCDLGDWDSASDCTRTRTRSRTHQCP